MNDMSSEINAPLLAAIEKIAKPARPETAMQSAERFIRKLDMCPEEAAELFEIVGLALSEWCEANKKHEGPLFSNLATLRNGVLEIGTGSR